MEFKLFADGGSRGNPGPAASGAVLFKNGEEVGRAGKFLGDTTNNVAEYTAIIIGLELALSEGVTELEVNLDSQLAVRQLIGEYKIKAEHIKPLAARVLELAAKFEKITFNHVKREFNKEADAIVNEVLDENA